MATLKSDQAGILRSVSESSPAHYTLKIQSFSLLYKNYVEKYESGEFEIGGFKWKLILYLNGNLKKNVVDHISLYLVMAESNSLHPSSEVNAYFRLFLLDQNNGTYLVLEDAKKRESCFHGKMTYRGFDQFIPLESFADASNGYLTHDTCEFGAEAFVSEGSRIVEGESLSMITNPIMYKHVWNVENFSKLDDEFYNPKSFIAGDHKWKISLHPKGHGKGKGCHLSLYLSLCDRRALPPGYRIFTEYSLRIVGQEHSSHVSYKNYTSFSAKIWSLGPSTFINLDHVSQAGRGFMKNDTCLGEAEVIVHGAAETLYSV